MRDSFDRAITYLRISVTDKCNLRCRYCMPPQGVTPRRHGDFLTLEQMADVARAAADLGIAKVRLTGGEPLVKRGIVDLARMIAAVDGIECLAMTTNGTLLAPLARPLREAGLDSINLSLDTLDHERYRALTRGGNIHDALAGLDAALAAGFPVKINMVVLDDTPAGEVERMREFTASRGARLQLINHFSLVEPKRDREAFDRPPPCERCNRIRLTADGMLKPCLHSDDEIRLDFARLHESLREAILAKPRTGGTCTERAMSQIGG